MTDQNKDKLRSNLVEEIRTGNEEAFKKFFFEYHDALYSYALQILKSKEKAKDIMQDVFLQIWKNRKGWEVNTSLKAYMFRSIRNTAFNKLSGEKTMREVLKKIKMRQGDKNLVNTEDQDHDAERIDEVWEAILDLPARRQSVFILHRKNGLSYKEIADVLEISVKTVESHMGLALKDIRAQVTN